MDVIGETSNDNIKCAETLSDSFKNLKIIIITRGEKGSIVFDALSKKTYEQDGKRVEVVSTVGAGDSFSASFMAKYIKTKDIEKSLKLATEISGFVVSKKDAIPEYDISDFE